MHSCLGEFQRLELFTYFVSKLPPLKESPTVRPYLKGRQANCTCVAVLINRTQTDCHQVHLHRLDMYSMSRLRLFPCVYMFLCVCMLVDVRSWTEARLVLVKDRDIHQTQDFPLNFLHMSETLSQTEVFI